MATVFRARWVIPADGHVIEDGAIVADGGRIVRIGPWPHLAPHAGPEDRVEHFPDAAILPGLVNAHTHLALSDLAGCLAPGDFAVWLGNVTAHLLLRPDSAARRALRQGIEDTLAAGTTAAADVAHGASCYVPASESRGRWVVFAEIFGFKTAGVTRVGRVARGIAQRPQAANIRLGLAPHAPYTAGVEVFMAARREADARGWPLTTHLHETEDEIAFTERGKGKLYESMQRIEWLPERWRPSRMRPIPMLARAGFFSGPVLVAHANYLTDEEIAILARSGSSVAFCPRSHAFFRHADHPWRRLLAAGVNVCLGTDSLASAPSLSVLDEAQFLFTRRGGEPRTVLEMATRRGALALGLEGETGDLAPGLAAEFCAVEPRGPTADPLAAILAGECGPARPLRA